MADYFEWTGSTSTVIKYYYDGATKVAMRTGSGTGTTGLNWLLGDHLGSTAITADSSGNKVAELRYKAWGESRYTYGTTPTKRQFTGQISEMATIGLYFYGARFYDPALSRFTSADSIIPGAGQVQAWDRYAAMLNNPLKYVDPTGHISERALYAGEADAISMDKMIELYEIKYSGSWSISQKASAMLGVDKVAMALAKHTYTNAVGTFNAVFGSLTFTRNSNTEDYCQAGGSGVTCGGAAPNDPRLYAHELGHTFNAVIVNNGNPSSPYSDLRSAAITDDDGNWVTGSHNGVFDRTFRGYQDEKSPFVYHGKDWDDWNSPNEDFADMFMNWAFNSFDYSLKARGAGAARYAWMETNMSTWISQASR